MFNVGVSQRNTTLNRNRRLLLWWSQQKKDVNDVNLQFLTMANPAMARRGGGGGGMAGLPPPPSPGSATARRDPWLSCLLGLYIHWVKQICGVFTLTETVKIYKIGALIPGELGTSQIPSFAVKGALISTIPQSYILVMCVCAPRCWLRGCTNKPAPFPGRMSYTRRLNQVYSLSYMLACFTLYCCLLGRVGSVTDIV